MKTKNYNPSELEVQMAESFKALEKEIDKKLPDFEIIKVENKIDEDNPMVKFYFLDNDGDPHEVVLKVIQLPDKF